MNELVQIQLTLPRQLLSDKEWEDKRWDASHELMTSCDAIWLKSEYAQNQSGDDHLVEVFDWPTESALAVSGKMLDVLSERSISTVGLDDDEWTGWCIEFKFEGAVAR